MFVFIFSLMGQEVIISTPKQDSLIVADKIQRDRAIKEPIIKKIYLPNSTFDYLEQHYYPNGQLYYQVPVVNGKWNGIYTEYYSNGQFHYEYMVDNGKTSSNSIIIDRICYDYFGNISCCILFKTQGRKLYKYVIELSSDRTFRYYHLFVYQSADHDKLVSEFRYYNGIWENSYQHMKPASNAKLLLRSFLKMWKQRGYDHISAL